MKIICQFLGDDVGGNEAEQRERLRTLSKKIDTDKNGQISSDELRVYIAQRIKFVSKFDRFSFVTFSNCLVNNVNVKSTNSLAFSIQIKQEKSALMLISKIISVISISRN